MAQKKPTDVTGRMREKLAADNAEALQESAEKMSMATAEAKVKLETQVVDATLPDRQTIIVDEVVTIANPEDDYVVIRVIQDIENMTFGAGNTYNIKAGVKTKVTKALANHLAEKGYLAGVI